MAENKIIFANELPDLEFITTGIPELDKIVQFPRGRVTEIYGLQAVGKTTLTLMSIAGLTKDGKKTLFIDAENAFNKDRAEELGVDLTKLAIATTNTVEEVSDLIMENMTKFDAIVVDSIAALVPRAEYEGKSGDANIGLRARLLGQFFRRATKDLADSKCALILINQLRESLEMFSTKYATPGGMSVRYHASLRIELITTSKDRVMEKGERAGHWVTAKIAKSKVGKPHQEARFRLMY